MGPDPDGMGRARHSLTRDGGGTWTHGAAWATGAGSQGTGTGWTDAEGGAGGHAPGFSDDCGMGLLFGRILMIFFTTF